MMAATEAAGYRCSWLESSPTRTVSGPGSPSRQVESLKSRSALAGAAISLRTTRASTSDWATKTKLSELRSYGRAAALTALRKSRRIVFWLYARERVPLVQGEPSRVNPLDD